jgi:hypothetical protein
MRYVDYVVAKGPFNVSVSVKLKVNI